jgi:hypothetical protein
VSELRDLIAVMAASIYAAHVICGVREDSKPEAMQTAVDDAQALWRLTGVVRH